MGASNIRKRVLVVWSLLARNLELKAISKARDNQVMSLARVAKRKQDPWTPEHNMKGWSLHTDTVSTSNRSRSHHVPNLLPATGRARLLTVHLLPLVFNPEPQLSPLIPKSCSHTSQVPPSRYTFRARVPHHNHHHRSTPPHLARRRAKYAVAMGQHRDSLRIRRRQRSVLPSCNYRYPAWRYAQSLAWFQRQTTKSSEYF